MDKILLDTDVILDFFFDRAPFSDDSAQILSLCESHDIKGFITPVILSNTYYLLRQQAKHEKVIEKLKELVQILDVLSINKAVILESLNSTFKDFEDALQNFAAQSSNKIDVIVTRNIKDYKDSELVVMTPENYLKIKFPTGNST